MKATIALCGALLFAQACIYAQTNIPAGGVEGTIRITGAIDASGATSTKPMKSGASLPATCSVGEFYNKTDAAAGSNIYGCTATNTWTVQAGGGGGASEAIDLTDFAVTRTSDTVLTIAAGRCIVENKDPVTVASAQIEVTSGTGTAFIYLDHDCSVQVKTSGTLAISCTSCTDAGDDTLFPDDIGRISEYEATSTVWEALASAVDQRELGLRIPGQTTAGTGIAVAQNSTTGGKTISVDTAIIPTKAAIQSGASMLCSDAGSSDTYTATMTPTLTAYTTGMTCIFHAGTVNTGAATLNIDGLGAKAIKKANGTSDPADGDIADEGYYPLTYDGTVFRLPAAAGSSSSTGCIPSVDHLCLLDEFIQSRSSSSNAGVYGWENVNDNGTGAFPFIDSEANHEGMIRLTTGATANNAVSLRQTNTYMAHSRLDNTAWTAEFIVRPNDVANSRNSVGFTNGSTAIQVYQTSGAAWKAEACTSSCFSGGASTGVTPVAGSWYYIKLVGTGSGVNIFVNGSGATAMTGTFPTTSMRAIFQVLNVTGTTGRTMDVDFFSMDREYGARY
jgi:hypothetical protein